MNKSFICKFLFLLKITYTRAHAARRRAGLNATERSPPSLASALLWNRGDRYAGGRITGKKISDEEAAVQAA